ncbi:MAG TPA: DUF4340 domain-containing protein [Bacteroidales bacterium]|nr:DUF4340 domain-containing protein [Bacteroidales bacterium]
MKAKNLSYLIVLMVVITTITLFLHFAGRQASIPERDRGFRLNYVNNIVRIEMGKVDMPALNLERNEAGVWRFNRLYTANDPAIRELLAALRQLNVRKPVALTDQDSINKLLDTEGIRLNVFSRFYLVRLPGEIRLFPFSRRVRQYLIGQDTPEGDGAYMRLFRSQIPFVVHIPGVERSLAGIFSPDESIWRDPVVVNLLPEQIARIEVSYNQSPEESFVIENLENKPVLLQNQFAVDSVLVNWDRVGRFLSSFTELYYDRLLTNPADSVMLEGLIEPAFFDITITDFLENRTNLIFYRRKADKEELEVLAPGTTADPNLFFMQVNSGKFAVGNYFVFNRIMRPLSFFLIH